MRLRIICLSLLMTILFSSISLANRYSDVLPSHWAYPVIETMSNKGIINGYPDGTFNPDKSITRAEFAKIFVISLNLNLKTEIDFVDIDNSFWGKGYVDIASRYMNYYMTNSRLYFSPNDDALREDVTKAIVTSLGLAETNYNIEVLNRFSDKNQISDETKKYIAIAVENGLVNGYGDGTFNPKGSLTRAQVCQIMQNALDIISRGTKKSSPKPTTKTTLAPTPMHSSVPTTSVPSISQTNVPTIAPTVISSTDSHTHNWSIWMPYTAEVHRRYCTLNMAHFEFEEHNFESGICTVCGFDPDFVTSSREEMVSTNRPSTTNVIIITKTPTKVVTSTPKVTTTKTPAKTTTSVPRVTITKTPAKTTTSVPRVTITKTPAKTTTPVPRVTVTKTPAKTATSAPIVTATKTPAKTATPAPRVTSTDAPVSYISVKVPTFKSMQYTGKEQSISEEEGYTLIGTTKATEVGEYSVIAKLKAGYVWENGNSGNVEIKWKIDKGSSSITVNDTIGNIVEGNSKKITYSYVGDGTLTITSKNTDIATISTDTIKNEITITGVRPGVATLSFSLTEGTHYKKTSKAVNVTISTSNRPIYNHSFSGRLLEHYQDSSIDVKIEEADGFFITKIWIADPSKQILKEDIGSSWNKKLKRVEEMMQGKNNAIVACNGSGFAHTPFWVEQEKYGGDWDNTPIGHLVITNGVIRRKRSSYNKDTLLGIMSDGSLKFFSGASYDTIINAGTISTIRFGGLLIKDGVKKTSSTGTGSAPRTAIGQIDRNNYIIIVAKASRSGTGGGTYSGINTSGRMVGGNNTNRNGSSLSTYSSNISGNNKTLDQVAEMGMKLNCNILYNCDGGGSSTLWYNGASFWYAQAASSMRYDANNDDAYRYGPRPVGDCIYFISTKK